MRRFHDRNPYVATGGAALHGSVRTCWSPGVGGCAAARLPWKSGGSDIIPITGVQVPLSEDQRARTRRYLISMAVRTICFVGAIIATIGWLRWALVAGAVFLPYIAVVMANAGRGRSRTAAIITQRAAPDRCPQSDWHQVCHRSHRASLALLRLKSSMSSAGIAVRVNQSWPIRAAGMASSGSRRGCGSTGR